MKLSDENKTAVLLNRLDFHIHEIQRREEKETQLFEWSTALLLAVFAVTLALADPTKQLPNPQLTKLVAIFLVTVPTVIFVWRVLGERKSMARQAEIVQRIEEELHLFDFIEFDHRLADANYPSFLRALPGKAVVCKHPD